MAKLMNLLSGQAREDKEVLGALQRLDHEKMPVRMEVENSQIHFRTRISVKSATVIVAKPGNLRDGLSKGGTVRFQLPESDGKEVRMEVVTPHFNLTNGNPVFLCKVPTEFAKGSMRGEWRFNTSRFNNVHLVIGDHASQYRIVDISSTGCKLYLNHSEMMRQFPVGEPIDNAYINLGNKVRVALESLIPRNHRGQSVGCQLRLDAEGNSEKYLHHLVQSLEKSEDEALHF